MVRMGLDEGMAGFFCACKHPNGKRPISKGKEHTAKQVRTGRSLVMDAGYKELDSGFFSLFTALWQQEVNIVHGVRTESNLGTWGLDLV